MVIPIGDALAGIVSSLNEFRVDPELIDKVVRSIEDGMDTLPREIQPVNQSSFGTLPRGVEMGQHTGNARDFMLKTYRELEELLASYADDIREFHNDATNIDQNAADQLRVVTMAIESNNRTRGIADGGDS